MTVQEGNTLIASFVDMYRPDYESLLYHTSWDWLMPVVEKIEAFDNRDVDSRITIENNTCNVYYYDGKMQEPYEFNIWSQNGKTEATWQSIVKFIQWYNQTNSK